MAHEQFSFSDVLLNLSYQHYITLFSFNCSMQVYKCKSIHHKAKREAIIEAGMYQLLISIEHALVYILLSTSEIVSNGKCIFSLGPACKQRVIIECRECFKRAACSWLLMYFHTFEKLVLAELLNMYTSCYSKTVYTQSFI